MHNNTQAKLGIKNLAEAKKYKRVGDIAEIAKDTGYHRNMVSLVYNMKGTNTIIEEAIIAKAEFRRRESERLTKKYLKNKK